MLAAENTSLVLDVRRPSAAVTVRTPRPHIVSRGTVGTVDTVRKTRAEARGVPETAGEGRVVETASPTQAMSVPPPPSPTYPMTPARARSVVGVILDESEGAAAGSLAQLLERPGYQSVAPRPSGERRAGSRRSNRIRRRHLRNCGKSQEVMLGHADAGARDALKAELRAVAAGYGVTLRFKAGILEGAGDKKVVALVDTAVSRPRTLADALADATNRTPTQKTRSPAKPSKPRTPAPAPTPTPETEHPSPAKRKREATGCWCRS